MAARDQNTLKSPAGDSQGGGGLHRPEKSPELEVHARSIASSSGSRRAAAGNATSSTAVTGHPSVIKKVSRTAAGEAGRMATNAVLLRASTERASLDLSPATNRSTVVVNDVQFTCWCTTGTPNSAWSSRRPGARRSGLGQPRPDALDVVAKVPMKMARNSSSSRAPKGTRVREAKCEIPESEPTASRQSPWLPGTPPEMHAEAESADLAIQEAIRELAEEHAAADRAAQVKQRAALQRAAAEDRAAPDNAVRAQWAERIERHGCNDHREHAAGWRPLLERTQSAQGAEPAEPSRRAAGQAKHIERHARSASSVTMRNIARRSSAENFEAAHVHIAAEQAVSGCNRRSERSGASTADLEQRAAAMLLEHAAAQNDSGAASIKAFSGNGKGLAGSSLAPRRAVRLAERGVLPSQRPEVNSTWWQASSREVAASDRQNDCKDRWEALGLERHRVAAMLKSPVSAATAVTTPSNANHIDSVQGSSAGSSAKDGEHMLEGAFKGGSQNSRKKRKSSACRQKSTPSWFVALQQEPSTDHEQRDDHMNKVFKGAIDEKDDDAKILRETATRKLSRAAISTSLPEADIPAAIGSQATAKEGRSWEDRWSDSSWEAPSSSPEHMPGNPDAAGETAQASCDLLMAATASTARSCKESETDDNLCSDWEDRLASCSEKDAAVTCTAQPMVAQKTYEPPALSQEDLASAMSRAEDFEPRIADYRKIMDTHRSFLELQVSRLSQDCFQEDSMAEYTQRDGWSLVLYHQGARLLGFLVYKRWVAPLRMIVVLRLAVVHEQRRQGFGKRLLDWIANFAQQLPPADCNKIGLSSMPDAVNFYGKMGFTESNYAGGLADDEHHKNGERQTWMEKRIKRARAKSRSSR